MTLKGKIVVPGEKVGSGSSPCKNCYVESNDLKSMVFGLNPRDNEVIPLAGRYMPQVKDAVIGMVSEVNYNNWVIDINCPYKCILPVAEVVRSRDIPDDLRRFYSEGDLVSVKIRQVNEIKQVYVEGARGLKGGRIIIIKPKKIPRVIGGRKSMLEMLREKTNCRINVGQNGIIWIDGNGEDMNLVTEAILKIEKEAHMSGLTDKISMFLDERRGKNGRSETD